MRQEYEAVMFTVAIGLLLAVFVLCVLLPFMIYGLSACFRASWTSPTSLSHMLIIEYADPLAVRNESAGTNLLAW